MAGGWKKTESGRSHGASHSQRQAIDAWSSQTKPKNQLRFPWEKQRAAGLLTAMARQIPKAFWTSHGQSSEMAIEWCFPPSSHTPFLCAAFLFWEVAGTSSTPSGEVLPRRSGAIERGHTGGKNQNRADSPAAPASC
ncbi:hypothetical protein RRG08_030167 [Elysia crispata]|uniref:Uncharacterized protein n=1 Tax=Elysia crispata TaxID=231223 RepID=A0AAE0ZRF6_9GAST|nr:hypothetical protein RRG08_030167 [Elysia crispata]